MADFYSYRPLPDDEALTPLLWEEMMQIQRHQDATWVRATIVSKSYPQDGYPDGLYVQGWLDRADDDGFEFPLEYVK